MKKIKQASIALFLFVLVGCSAKTARRAPKVYTVKIRQMQFQPAELEVKKGDTVVFENEDIVAHNITDLSASKWTPAILPSGKSWKLAVEQSADYYCSIHPVMKGRLLVGP